MFFVINVQIYKAKKVQSDHLKLDSNLNKNGSFNK